jgi:DNA-binding response OmpR family regulator
VKPLVGARVALSTGMPLSGSPPTILIADDDHAIAAALVVLFELYDFHADAVHTPADALERVRQSDVCLVVHDMNFSKGDTSGIDGLSLFHALRREAPKLPLILMTSWPSSDTSALVLREGAAAYLVKPWDDERLVALVRGLVRDGSPSRLATS